MSFKKVVVAGGGVLGTQIAFQSAYCGFDVTIWLRSQGSIGRTQPKIDHVKAEYLEMIEKMEKKQDWALGIADQDHFDPEECRAQVEKAYKSIKLELDMKKAFENADLVIESMAEDAEAKKEFFKLAAPLLPEKTIIVTNSSSLLPSKFTKYTGRPDKYLALHFANEIWKNNSAEVMAQEKTDPANFKAVLQFAKEIGMIPLEVRKEKAGYLLNSMLIPFLFSALDLWVTGVSDPEDIDKAWLLGTHAPKGPFQIVDVVGLTTAYNIVCMYTKIPGFLAPYHFKAMAAALKKKIDAGELGIAAGKGFYSYKK